MRRRQALVDEYLRSHDPLGTSDRAETWAHTPEPPQQLQRRRPFRGATAAVAAGLAAAALVLGSSIADSTGPLSAEQAVAAVAADLQADRVLEWQWRSFDPSDQSLPTMSSSSWTDLATGDEHSVTDEPAYRSRGKLVDNRFYAWRTKDADWSARAPKDASGPITVNEYEAGYLGFGAFGGNQTPVEFLGEVLRRASRSEGELTETTPERGVPVVIATAPSTIRDPAARGARLYLSVWITREEQPRILRTATEMRCASGDPCDPSPADGKDDVQPFGASETLVWTVHPRTPETLAKVALPPDGGRFKLNPR